jgi:hypothetical protein
MHAQHTNNLHYLCKRCPLLFSIICLSTPPDMGDEVCEQEEETILRLSDVYVTEMLPRSVVVLYVSIIVSFTVGVLLSLTPRQPLHHFTTHQQIMTTSLTSRQNLQRPKDGCLNQKVKNQKKAVAVFESRPHDPLSLPS